MSDMIIPLLCVVIGLLIAMLCFGYFKNRDKPDAKNKGKAKTNSKGVKAEKEKMEFSKVILIVTFAIAVVVISFAMVIIYMGAVSGLGSDSSNLNSLLGGLFVEISAGTSLYYWKSRKENIIKLESQYGRRVLDEENGDDIV